MFICIHCIDQNCRYALGHEFSRIPHTSSLVALYKKSNRRTEIVGHVSCIIGHLQNSIKMLIIPSVRFYSNMYKLQPYQLLIPITCIKLTTLQILYHKVYLYMHPSYCIQKFKNTTPLYFSFISAVNANHVSSEASHKYKEPDPDVATHPWHLLSKYENHLPLKTVIRHNRNKRTRNNRKAVFLSDLMDQPARSVMIGILAICQALWRYLAFRLHIAISEPNHCQSANQKQSVPSTKVWAKRFANPLTAWQASPPLIGSASISPMSIWRTSLRNIYLSHILTSTIAQMISLASSLWCTLTMPA